MWSVSLTFISTQHSFLIRAFWRYWCEWVIRVFMLSASVSFSLIPSSLLLQSFHSDSDRPDVCTGTYVGVWGLPVWQEKHSGCIHLHCPQQPAGSADLHHALPFVQTGKIQHLFAWGWHRSTTMCNTKEEACNDLRFVVVIFFMMLWCPLQVREEYVHFFSCICKPQKRYSDFSSTNPSSSQSQVRILRPLPLSVSHKYTLVHIHCLTFKMSCFFSSRVLGVDSKLENHKYEDICLISNPEEYI